MIIKVGLGRDPAKNDCKASPSVILSENQRLPSCDSFVVTPPWLFEMENWVRKKLVVLQGFVRCIYKIKQCKDQQQQKVSLAQLHALYKQCMNIFWWLYEHCMRTVQTLYSHSLNVIWILNFKSTYKTLCEHRMKTPTATHLPSSNWPTFRFDEKVRNIEQCTIMTFVLFISFCSWRCLYACFM